MQHGLGEQVFVIQSVKETTDPCEKCGLSDVESVFYIKEALVSDVFTHFSTTEKPQVKYRVRVDGEVVEPMWYGQQQVFSTFEEADTALDKMMKEKKF